MENYYRNFPWLGFYLKAIRKSSNFKIFEPILIAAVLLSIFILYFVYIALAKITSNILFYNEGRIPRDISENFFGLMASIELTAVFFFRTRETLYYCPKLLLLASAALFLYIDLTPYGFYKDAFLVHCIFSIGVVAYCISSFEFPAMELAEGDFARPSLYRPRTLM